MTITGDITEPGTQALNSFASPYTITIKPDGATLRTLSGNYNGSLIRLNGADRVNIDGRSGGTGSYLHFTNTRSGNNVIELLDNATNNTIQNCLIESNGGTGIFLSSGNASGGNDDNTIQNCTIKDNASGRPAYGIRSYQATVVPDRENKNNIITGNYISNFTTYGLSLDGNGNGGNWQITNNHFFYNHATVQTASSCGIRITSTASESNTITGNYIGGDAASCGGAPWLNSGDNISYGIYLTLKTDGNWTEVDNNTIKNISKSGTGTSAFMGINIINGNAKLGTTNGNTIDDIEVAGTGTAACYGINSSAATAKVEVIKNTISNFFLTNSLAGLFRGISIVSNYDIPISKNRIINCGPTHINAASQCVGILADVGATQTAIYTITNNLVSLGYGITNNAICRGIVLSGSSTNIMNLYYNTVYLGGTSNGSNITDALYKDDANTCVIKNNLLFNSRSGTAAGYGLSYTNATNLTSDYNFIVGTTTEPVRWGNTGYTFINYKGTSTKDASSWATQSSVLSATDLFLDVAIGNLGIRIDNPVCWYINGAGDPIASIAEGIGGNARSIARTSGPTDIGAFEFEPQGGVSPPLLSASEPFAVGNSSIYWQNGRAVAKIAWKTKGTSFPDAVTVRYYSGGRPSDGTLPLNDFAHVYFDINATGGDAYFYDLLLYFDAALLGEIGSESKMYISKSNAIDVWAKVAGASYSQKERYIMITAQTSFSRFLFIEDVDDNTSLPVELLAFKGDVAGRSIQLSWETATESNSERFDIMHSSNMEDFYKIGSLNAAGNANKLTQYTFTHANPDNGLNYYRLMQYDFDGNASAYGPLVVSIKTREASCRAWFDEYAILNLELSNQSEDVRFELLDTYGKLIRSEKINLHTNSFKMPCSSLSAGIYFIRLSSASGVETLKIVR